MNSQLADQLLADFEVEAVPGLFVLGCFARCVTLYSQQVRALNLVAALLTSNRLEAGKRMAVIGAGAAGLTAAAAAALHGVKVEVLEELDGPLEFQANNRQRWLHPHIYDWPNEKYRNDPNAHLPILNWQAGYAEAVAGQILKNWEALRKQFSIQVSYNVGQVSIERGDNCVELTWESTDRMSFDAVVVAVGFGLESKEGNHTWSYWSEDDIDGAFRMHQSGKWLVSGCGDGALTDLMRLCIRKFRHADVLKRFAWSAGYPMLMVQLQQMQKECHGQANLMHQKFYRLRDLDVFVDLKDSLEASVRKGLKVYLAAREKLYGAPSSILNRLIVLALAELKAFKIIPAGIQHIEPEGDGFKVRMTNAKYDSAYDKVIVRHGPKAAINKFEDIVGPFTSLRERWKDRTPTEDRTRYHQFAWDFFSQKSAPPYQPLQSSFRDDSLRYGVSARALRITKTLRNDGSSELECTIEDLKVHGDAIRGIEISVSSTAGMIGEPIFSPSLRSYSWTKDDVPLSQSDSVPPYQLALDRGRHLFGRVKFKEPLKRENEPITIGFTVMILNGDALTEWESLQLYGHDHVQHASGQRVAEPKEFFARIVWFPIEELSIQISLPASGTRSPVPRFHQYREHTQITREELVHDGFLQIRPPVHSDLSPERTSWDEISQAKWQAFSRLEQNESLHTWKLTVAHPAVGTCVSLNWDLIAQVHDELTAIVEESAARFRSVLLEHGDLRRRRRALPAHNETIMNCFEAFSESILRDFGLGRSDETFEISLMVYDSSWRRLRVIEGRLNGEDPDDHLWSFSPPFGASSAGACFRNGGRAIVYFAPKKAISHVPEWYLITEKGLIHDSLICIPLDLPETPQLPPDFELGRQCVGIVNIGSTSPNTKLRALQDKDGIIDIRNRCQVFCNSLYEELRDLGALE